jgi:hypothetical protein
MSPDTVWAGVNEALEFLFRLGLLGVLFGLAAYLTRTLRIHWLLAGAASVVLALTIGWRASQDHVVYEDSEYRVPGEVTDVVTNRHPLCSFGFAGTLSLVALLGGVLLGTVLRNNDAIRDFAQRERQEALRASLEKSRSAAGP